MSFALLPFEIKLHILNFAVKTPNLKGTTDKHVKSFARVIKKICLFNQRDHDACVKQLKILKEFKISLLVKKYHIYNSQYESQKSIAGGPPTLLDALYTGYSTRVIDCF